MLEDAGKLNIGFDLNLTIFSQTISRAIFVSTELAHSTVHFGFDFVRNLVFERFRMKVFQFDESFVTIFKLFKLKLVELNNFTENLFNSKRT